LQSTTRAEGVAACEKGLAISPGSRYAMAILGYAYAVTGRKAEAQGSIDRLTDVARNRYVPSWATAIVYAGLGEKQKAIELLEKGVDEHSLGSFAMVRVEPIWDPLRSDPRFTDLLRRMNLQP
jgi:serine/threonine-protein kinase